MRKSHVPVHFSEHQEEEETVHTEGQEEEEEEQQQVEQGNVFDLLMEEEAFNDDEQEQEENEPPFSSSSSSSPPVEQKEKNAHVSGKNKKNKTKSSVGQSSGKKGGGGKKKNKKNKGRRGQNRQREDEEDADDFLEMEYRKAQQAKREQLLKRFAGWELSDDKMQDMKNAWQRILGIDTEHLNQSNEMSRMFGKQVVIDDDDDDGINEGRSGDLYASMTESGIGRRQQRRIAAAMKKKSQKTQQRKRTPLSNLVLQNKPKSSWPQYQSSLLRLQNVTDSISNPSEEQSPERNNKHRFRPGEHVFDWQITGSQLNQDEFTRRQMQLQVAVESHDVQNVVNLFHRYPYHIPILLQLSDVFLMQNDMNTYSDFIERCLYAFEVSMNASDGTSFWEAAAEGTARLHDNGPLNRLFVETLHRRAHAMTRTNTYRTGLEIVKILIQLTTMRMDDSMCYCMLIVDYFVLRSREFDYLLDMLDSIPDLLQVAKDFKQAPNQLGVPENLPLLPNLMYSKALAMFQQSQSMSTSEVAKAMELLFEASRVMQDAICTWPGFIVTLMESGGLGTNGQDWEPHMHNLKNGATRCNDEVFSRVIHSTTARMKDLWKELCTRVVPMLNPNEIARISFKEWIMEQVKQADKDMGNADIVKATKERRDRVIGIQAFQKWYANVTSNSLLGSQFS